jgi:hypothetical protein
VAKPIRRTGLTTENTEDTESRFYRGGRGADAEVAEGLATPRVFGETAASSVAEEFGFFSGSSVVNAS